MKTDDLQKRLAELSTQSKAVTVGLEQLAKDAALPDAPPPPPPPPPTGKTGLYVSGGKLLRKDGTPVVIRGIELMYGPDSQSNPGRQVANCKTFGANAIGPLYKSPDLAVVKTHLDLCKAAGLIVGVNSDHLQNGRAWFTAPPTVALLKQYDNIFLQCEVELGSDFTPDTWGQAAAGIVQAFRAAGHTAPIKVGSPQGGRLPRFALERGAEVLAGDPLRNLLFTWQSYWGLKTNGWTYQGESGFTPGMAGTLECADAIKQSGLCFLVGLDGKDDIGPTGFEALAARLRAHGIGWQWWCLTGDGLGNNLVDSSLSPTLTGEFGAKVSALLKGG